MPIVVDVAQASQGRQVLDVPGYTNTAREEDQYYVTMYTGAPPETAAKDMPNAETNKELPQCYFVEQPANSTLPPHYHDTDQFQVFTSGELRFGKKAIGALSVHFAGGHTPYGPIYTDKIGTHFFTLRANWDSGGKPMPESRPKLQPVRRMYRLAGNVDTSAEQKTLEVIPAEDNGLAVTLFHLKSGQTQTIDTSVAGGGQYALVMDGCAIHGDKELALHSCLYRYADEPALQLSGGKDGASVLLLQFPSEEALERTRPS